MDKTVNNSAALVSVILPVYNAEKYVRDAIRSILDQTYNNIELIIIDDGSTDNSAKVISGFTDSRIVYVANEKNIGLIESLNKGLKLAKGKYIARMDADDISLPVRFEKQVKFLESQPQIALCGTDYFSFSGKHHHKKTTLKGPDVLKTWLLFAPPVCHPTVMMRTEVLRAYNFSYNKSFKHVEDYELWTQIARHAALENLNEVLLNYRDHEGQVSHQKRLEQIHNSKLVQANYLEALGFSYTEKELETHNFISSNARIKSEDVLKEINSWLHSLIVQNEQKKIINPLAFNWTIGRMFYDCCGNTNLGLRAYRLWLNSKLKRFYGDTFMLHLKLRAKCLIRRFS